MENEFKDKPHDAHLEWTQILQAATKIRNVFTLT